MSSSLYSETGIPSVGVGILRITNKIVKCKEKKKKKKEKSKKKEKQLLSIYLSRFLYSEFSEFCF